MTKLSGILTRLPVSGQNFTAAHLNAYASGLLKALERLSRRRGRKHAPIIPHGRGIDPLRSSDKKGPEIH